ncbi:hypothetical protein B5807_09349 [Epicoccum nigrum]|uniref:Uncharacterized protein n=1 Tax=Epicoccum nigrum TaxID=105696 RepID=A0A1Y2LMA8_EPING|nr:hypothetical protein B5807_09349 [Epicoccum nigrum]
MTEEEAKQFAINTCNDVLGCKIEHEDEDEDEGENEGEAEENKDEVKKGKDYGPNKGRGIKYQ